MNKLLFYYHHVGGLGHGTRILAICKTLKKSNPDIKLLVVNSGLPQPELGINRFAIVINLPPFVDKEGGAAILITRGRILGRIARSYRPDAVVFEHFPFGRRSLMPEILPFIKNLKKNNAKIYSSVRDIITRHIDKKKLSHTLGYFDAVLVHASREEGFKVPCGIFPKLRKKIIFTGRVHPHGPRKSWVKIDSVFRPIDKKNKLIVVNPGGGADGLKMIQKVLMATRYLSDHIVFLVVTGPSLGADKMKSIIPMVKGKAHIMLKSYLTDFFDYVRAANLTISMAGYNSINNILLTGAKAIVFPRDSDQEQVIRAVRFKKSLAIEKWNTPPAQLARHIEILLKAPRKKNSMPHRLFGGAEKTARFLSKTLLST
jgi:predicted glycosyltransferase